MIDWGLDAIAKDLIWTFIAVGVIVAVAVVSLFRGHRRRK